MSFQLSSIRDEYKPIVIQSTPPVMFEFIDTHETEPPLQPNHIQVGHAPIRHAKSQRKIGNSHVYEPSTFDFIDVPKTCIVSNDVNELKTSSDHVIQSIRSMIKTLHTKD
jgi:hypothetical protein